MNVFELLVFSGMALCGLLVFRWIESRAGFWAGAMGFFLAFMGAACLWHFFVKGIGAIEKSRTKPKENGQP